MNESATQFPSRPGTPSLVVLTGPPGAGKSTVGALLAEQLGAPFADTDELIVQRAGKPITDIFVDDGETAFRAMEHEVVASSLRERTGVLSLGGGAVMYEPTQALLRDQYVVFLDVTLRFAARRSGFDQGRPLMALNPRGQWLTLMEKRRPVYTELSNVIVDTDNKDAGTVAAEIAALISGAGPRESGTRTAPGKPERGES